MGEVLGMLGGSPLFAALEPGERARLEKQLVRRTWGRDDYVFFEGEPAEWLILLVSGRVKMIKHSESGRETILATFGPGEIVGEVGVLVGDTYPATAQALEPAVTAGLRRDEYVALVQSHPELAWALIVELGRRLQRAHETMRSMAVEKVERRVARVLLRMANTAGERLGQIPVVVKQNGALEVVAERQAYLLYDRMVAFHIQRGCTVPLGAAEFYAGLKQRFPERDEMYFLPDQAAEYDRERMRATKVEQLALFVTDEKSAIQWLRRELDPETGAGPQTYQDLQPKFLRELHQARHEDLPELSDMLAQSFLKDEQDRWYVPDPGRQGDLEKLRERSLLREFGEYAQGKGRLKVFRTEAVRAGFKHAWHERDYNLIVKVAERLPPSVLKEDAGLLMYYDNALMRAEAEPVQGRLL